MKRQSGATLKTLTRRFEFIGSPAQARSRVQRYLALIGSTSARSQQIGLDGLAETLGVLQLFKCSECPEPLAFHEPKPNWGCVLHDVRGCAHHPGGATIAVAAHWQCIDERTRRLVTHENVVEIAGDCNCWLVLGGIAGFGQLSEPIPGSPMRRRMIGDRPIHVPEMRTLTEAEVAGYYASALAKLRLRVDDKRIRAAFDLAVMEGKWGWHPLRIFQRVLELLEDPVALQLRADRIEDIRIDHDDHNREVARALKSWEPDALTKAIRRFQRDQRRRQLEIEDAEYRRLMEEPPPGTPYVKPEDAPERLAVRVPPPVWDLAPDQNKRHKAIDRARKSKRTRRRK